MALVQRQREDGAVVAMQLERAVECVRVVGAILPHAGGPLLECRTVLDVVEIVVIDIIARLVHVHNLSDPAANVIAGRSIGLAATGPDVILWSNECHTTSEARQ